MDYRNVAAHDVPKSVGGFSIVPNVRFQIVPENVRVRHGIDAG
jgi:hypothetical protein